jgi:hypothetical protein
MTYTYVIFEEQILQYHSELKFRDETQTQSPHYV